MKNLDKFILERLKLNRDTKIASQRILDEDKLKNSVWKIRSKMAYKRASEEARDWEKMQGYRKKYENLKPKIQKLVNDISVPEKLLRRWLIAIQIDWEDYYDMIRQKLIDNYGYTEDELDYYILNKYNDSDDGHNKKYYKDYLDKYNVKY